MPFKRSISSLSLATSAAWSPPASKATATRITTARSYARIGFLPGVRTSHLLSDEGHESAAARCERDDQPRRGLPEREQSEGREGETHIGRPPDRAGPHRLIERGQEQPD